MARGWESKSVEDQMAAAQAAKAERDARAKARVSPEEREQSERRQSLLLSRSQILSRLKATQNARYRAQLELALEHLDAQLR
jgi:hypothetical protein